MEMLVFCLSIGLIGLGNFFLGRHLAQSDYVGLAPVPVSFALSMGVGLLARSNTVAQSVATQLLPGTDVYYRSVIIVLTVALIVALWTIAGALSTTPTPLSKSANEVV